MTVDLHLCTHWLRSCVAPRFHSQGQQLHQLLLKSGHASSLFASNCLLQMYSRCSPDLTDARRLFDEMLHRNCFSWNLFLDACIKSGDRTAALELFDSMSERNTFSWNAIVTGLVRYGDLENARRLFEEMPMRDAVACNAVIHGYARRGQVHEAFRLFKKMGSDFVGPSSPCNDGFVLATVLSACADHVAHDFGKQIHARIVISQVDLDTVLGSTLVNMYAKCEDFDSACLVLDSMLEPDDFSLSALISGYAGHGSLVDARKVFDKRENPGVALWNSIINGYVINDQGEEALHLFRRMRREGVMPDSSTLVSLLGASMSFGELGYGKQLHACCFRHGHTENIVVASALIDSCSKSGYWEDACKVFSELKVHDTVVLNSMISVYSNCGRIVDAKRVFESIHSKSLISWNSMIVGCSQNGLFEEGFELLYKMQELGVRFSEYTLSLAASCVSDARHAKQVHGFLIRSGLNSSNTVMDNALIDMYGRVGVISYACGVFRAMEDLDVISWNSMISVYGNSGHGEKALECFRSMRTHRFPIDEFTVASVIHVCADLGHLAKGEQLVAQCFKMGFLSNFVVSSAVIDLYSMCGRLENSIQLFQEMDRWDSALCNSMVSTYARSRLVHEALSLFVVALRKEMRPTGFTFASILRSSSCFGLTEQGTQIHCWVFKLGFEADLIVSSALVDMYTKLGSTEPALKIFSAMATRDLVFWNTMIMGLAQNGQGTEALRIFKQMQDSGTKPDRITLVGVLSACSHEGMVHEGKRIFSSMEKKYGVVRGLEHYNCMVDMMGQAGRLREAMEIIETMPHKPIAATWELLLEACRIHRNMQLEEIVAEKVMELEPRTSFPYFVLARMYGTRGRWESMARVWKTMGERGVKKVGGCSWICIRNLIFIFNSDQILHHGGEDTYLMLRLLCWEMVGEGYVPEQHEEMEDQEM